VGALILAGLLSFALFFFGGRVAPPAANSSPSVAGSAHVIDGDTIAIGEVRIRLEGIDAPELAQTCGRSWRSAWPCGREAAGHLERLVRGREVICRTKGYDAYGRMLGVCFAAGLELNARMVQTGMAWAFARYSQSYSQDEAGARARKQGIWKSESEPAWTYRARRWPAAEHPP
jgi:endonuclease YncB( thermonuclease family)